MAEKSLSVDAVTAGVAALVAAALAVLTELTKDWPSLPRWAFFGTLVLFFVMWPYYFFYVLTGSGEESESNEKREYRDFRLSLASGGTFNLAYVAWLNWTLDKVDVFFGDAKPALHERDDQLGRNFPNVLGDAGLGPVFI